MAVMRVAIYVRLLPDSVGEVTSLEIQELEGLRFCRQRAWPVAKVYADSTLGASRMQRRPQFESMLSDAKAGQFDAIVSNSWMVLTRHASDQVHLIKVGLEQQLRIFTKDVSLDLSSKEGRQIAEFQASLAQAEAAERSARQTRGNLAAVARGQHFAHTRVFGWTDHNHRQHPKEAAAIRQAALGLIEGSTTLSGIARTWNELGLRTTRGRPFTNVSVKKALTKPQHAGLQAYRGNIVGALKVKPILDRETYAELLAVMDNPTSSSIVRKYPYTSLPLCGECGKAMARTVRHGSNYECPAGHNSIRSRVLDELLEAELARAIADTAEQQSEPAIEQVSALRQHLVRVGEQEQQIASDPNLGWDFKLSSARRLMEERDEVALRLAYARTVSTLQLLIAELSEGDIGIPRLRARFDALSVTSRRALCQHLLEITVASAGKGNRRSDASRGRVSITRRDPWSPEPRRREPTTAKSDRSPVISFLGS